MALRTKKPTIADLLAYWHGDSHVAGWASPTLAMNIALLSRPSSAKALAETIYPEKDEDGRHMIPVDAFIHTTIKRGYDLYLRAR